MSYAKTIYFNLKDFDSQNTEADINAELEKVKTWLKLNKLSLNAQNCDPTNISVLPDSMSVVINYVYYRCSSMGS